MNFTSSSFTKPTGAAGALTAGTGLIYLAKADDMTTIATRFATPTTAEEEVSVDGDHAFTSGKGFAPFYHDPQITETNLVQAMNGEGIGANTMIELTAFYPGKSFEVEALLKERPELICLVGDIDCGNANYTQIGDRCQKAFISEWSHNQGNANDTTPKGYTIKIKAYSTSILNYAGTISIAS